MRRFLIGLVLLLLLVVSISVGVAVAEWPNLRQFLHGSAHARPIGHGDYHSL